MPTAVGTGQVGGAGPVKRGEKHISISFKIDDAQYRWITCPEVSVCLSVSLLSLEGVQIPVPDHGHKFQCLKPGEVYLAVHCFVSLQFQLEIVVLGFFFKCYF